MQIKCSKILNSVYLIHTASVYTRPIQGFLYNRMYNILTYSSNSAPTIDLPAMGSRLLILKQEIDKLVYACMYVYKYSPHIFDKFTVATHPLICHIHDKSRHKMKFILGLLPYTMLCKYICAGHILNNIGKQTIHCNTHTVTEAHHKRYHAIAHYQWIVDGK